MQLEARPNTWEIEHQCPQCGAPITLGETDRLLSCSYCRTRLYLIPKDYFRYYLPPPDLLSKDLIFIPYWRLRGIAFFCKADHLQHRVIDVSSLALRQPLMLPPSLGFRPQVLKLRFISPKIGAKFFSPQLPFETVIQSIGMQMDPFDGAVSMGPAACKAFIGEAISLIYSPIFIDKEMAHDAIIGKPLTSIPKGFTEGLLSFDQQEDWQIKFISTLCPRCGWDLLGERDSVALFCKNCNSGWEASSMGFKELDFGMIPSKEENGCYLPFWRMKVHIESGVKIPSYADLLKGAKVAKAMEGEEERADLYFWCPAFKVPPELFLTLAQTMTISPPREEFERSLPWPSLYPVTLPAHEAAESMKITMANLAIHKKMILPELDEIKTHLNESLLVYLPFTPCGIDFIEPHTKLCINKNRLRLGRNL